MRPRTGNKSALLHLVTTTKFEFRHRPEIMKLSNSSLNVLSIFADFFFHLFPGWKQVGSSSFYHFYKIRISTLIFRPETINLPISFLTVFECICWPFSFVPGLEASWYNLIFIIFTKFEFRPLFFRPRLWIFSIPSQRFYNSFLIFFINFRAGNKSVYPHFITFTKFEFQPLIFRPEIMNRSNSFLIVLKVFPDFFSCVSGLEISRYILNLSLLRNSNFTPYFSAWDYESF